MALKDIWKDKTDGVDDVLAQDINSIAQAAIQNEKDISEQSKEISRVSEEMSEKANVSDIYYRETIDAMVNAKADINDVYYRGTIDALLGDKANKADLVDKADKGTTLADYGITNAYTKEEVDNLIGESGGGSSSEWKKIADITTTEEVNGIVATSEEFPEIPKCKEFILRAVFPKSPTGAAITLGAAFCYLNDNTHTAYRFTATTINASAITEQRTHIIIADSMIYSTGTYQASGQGAVTTQAYTLIGNRFISEDVTSIIYKLNESANNYPIGTRFVIYGKVESVQTGALLDGDEVSY